MLKIKSYVKAESLQQAYELNQTKTAVILGGMVWLKMGNRRVSTAIDLSGLDLCGIQEDPEEFVIGCMTPLHDLEAHRGLLHYTGGAIKECLRHIVGVQFRNCATVGGSIWGRYGFSDVLTLFLAMDTWVELYKGGRIPLSEFALYGKGQRYPFAPDHQEKENQDLLSEPAKYKDRFSGAYLLRLQGRGECADSDRGTAWKGNGSARSGGHFKGTLRHGSGEKKGCHSQI